MSANPSNRPSQAGVPPGGIDAPTEQENQVDIEAFKAHENVEGGGGGGGGVVECLCTAGSLLLVVLFLPFTIWFCFKVVREYERAVIFRMGRLRSGGARGPGTFFILPCLDDYRCIDLRTRFYDIPPQEILTHDSVTVAVDAVIYYRVFNPVIACANVADYMNATQLLSATTLRNVLGTKNLTEVLTDRDSIASLMQHMLDDATDPWGVKVERVEMKDVRLPEQLQRAMAAEAEATREARAKVIAAEGELSASKALKEAADVMVASPAALQLRYLQTLGTIAAEKNSTIIFPLPIDLLAPFMRRTNIQNSTKTQIEREPSASKVQESPRSTKSRHVK